MKLKAIMLKEYPEVFYRFHPIHFVRATVEVTKKGIFHSTEQTKTLYSSAEKACPKFKQIDKFLARLKNNLEEVLAEKEVELLVGKQKSLPKTISNDKLVYQVKEDKPESLLSDLAIENSSARRIRQLGESSRKSSS